VLDHFACDHEMDRLGRGVDRGDPFVRSGDGRVAFDTDVPSDLVAELHLERARHRPFARPELDDVRRSGDLPYLLFEYPQDRRIVFHPERTDADGFHPAVRSRDAREREPGRRTIDVADESPPVFLEAFDAVTEYLVVTAI